MESDLFEKDTDYVLVEESSTDELQTPLKRSSRLKYNCVSVSSKLVAIGSNTGGIYVYSRADQKLLQIAFAEKETGSISFVKISPHEKFVAFISSNNVHVLDLRLESRSKAETLKSSNVLIGCSVTCLHWDVSSTKLYVGDDLGNVSMMSVSSSKAMNIFSLPLEVIMKLDSVIVQIDNVEDKILVSTLTRCYLCQTNKQQYSQIGHRLRDGYYGACFLQQSTSAPMIYCARPGSRIWEVDFEGTVLNTHQFKQLLSVPPRKLVDTNKNYEQFVTTETYPSQSVAFPKLLVLWSRFILTWTSNSLYVLDPINVKVILWTNQFSDIVDVSCSDHSIYIFFKSMKIECISFLPVTSVLPLYLKINNLNAAANMCSFHRQIFAHKHVRKRFGVTEMTKLYDNLVSSDMNDLAEQVREVLTDVEEKIAAEAELELSNSLSYQSKSSVHEKSDSVLNENKPQNDINNDMVTDAQNDTEKGDAEKVIENQDGDHVAENNIDHTSQIKQLPEVTVSEFDKLEIDTLQTQHTEDFRPGNGINGLDNDVKSEQLTDTVNGEICVAVLYDEIDKSDTSNVHYTHKGDSEHIANDRKVEQNTVHSDLSTTDPSVSRLVTPETHLRMSSPVSMDTSDNLLLEDEDDVGYLPTKELGPRRLSSASLSSLSSAEVFVEPGFSFDNESSDPIAMPVKRRSSRKKGRRKSGIDVNSSGSLVARKSSSSRSKSSSSSKDVTLSPQGSVHSLKEEDSISIYSNDSVNTEDGTVAVVTSKESDIPDGNTEMISSEVTVGSPVSYSEEFTHSEDFSRSGDYLQSGEFSPGETTLSQSMEMKQGSISSSSSAPKTALLQFKNKMQNKVSTKTKGLIRNIKEKNLLSKAKEIAGNLSQGSDAYLHSGEIPYGDSLSLQMSPDYPDGVLKTTSIISVEENEDARKVSVDLTDLQEITAKTVDMLKDLKILCDTEAVKGVLENWIKVLNTTFKNFHIEKYGPNGDGRKKDEINAGQSKESSNKVNTGELAINKPDDNNDDDDDDKDGQKLKTVRDIVSMETENIPDPTDKNYHEHLEVYDEIARSLKGPQFCYIKDPLFLPQDLFCQVCDLVQACFDISCHGNLLSFINFNQSKSADCDKSSMIPYPNFCDTNQCDENSDGLLNIQQPTNTKHTASNELNLSCDTDGVLPPGNQVQSELDDTSSLCDTMDKQQRESALKDVSPNCADCVKLSSETECKSTDTDPENVNSEDCSINQDYIMGLFTRCYFPYLCVLKTREKSRSRNNHFYLWCALTVCMEEKSSYDAEKFGVEDKSLISYMMENQAHTDAGAALLGHVSKLFKTNHSTIVDACVRCYPYVQPLDVVYICRYHQISMETVYKQYMDCMTNRGSAGLRKEILNYLSGHMVPALVWLDLLLCDNEFMSKVKDEDGCPRCMSHTMPWKNAKSINEFTNLVVTNDGRTQVLELFRKHGYWIGVLKLLKSAGCRDEHLMLVLQLGDVRLLGEDNVLGFQPQSETDWEEVLNTFVQVSSKTRNQQLDVGSSDWSNVITWNNLAILLVKHIGAEATVSMLKRRNTSEQVLTTHFYQTCLLSGMVQKQQRLILHSMLEKVDTYLWSQRPTSLNPQMQYLALTEKKVSMSESSDVSADILPNMVSRIQKQNSDLYIEDPDCHWGIESKINMLCKFCYIRLREIVSHEEPGVLVFKCGHSFHKFCLPGKQCPFCVDKK